MSLSLAKLQDQFAKALLYQATAQECHIIDDHFEAEERIKIYRNNFITSLGDILALTYPSVQSLVGNKCFDGLAYKHVLLAPLLRGDVSTYGSGFAETIDSVKPIAASVPYLSDVARLEWAIDDSNQKRNNLIPSAHYYSFEKLQDIDVRKQAQIQLCLQPQLNLFYSNYSVHSIRDAIKNNNFKNVSIDQPQYCVVLTLSESELLIECLTKDEFLLLSQIMDGLSLEQIHQNLLPHLQKLISLNLFIGFQTNKPLGDQNDLLCE